MENNEQFNDPTMNAPESEAVFATPTGSEKAFAILAYFGILWLIGLLKDPEKDVPYVKNHVNNGIILCIAGVAAGILNVIPIIGNIASIVLYVAITVFAIIGIVKACTNTTYTIPLIGDKLVLIK
ncbi:Uncharacterized membrane protein [Ruminococcaceae bacterium YRB3002]|nr:Uncharacterized membrane protein [Ruminococcaceae bacterium YRB3002]